MKYHERRRQYEKIKYAIRNFVCIKKKINKVFLESRVRAYTLTTVGSTQWRRGKGENILLFIPAPKNHLGGGDDDDRRVTLSRDSTTFEENAGSRPRRHYLEAAVDELTTTTAVAAGFITSWCPVIGCRRLTVLRRGGGACIICDQKWKTKNIEDEQS